MAAPTKLETLDSLYASTWPKLLEQSEDFIFDARPLTHMALKRGKIRRSAAGGRRIEKSGMYAKNLTVTSFGRGSQLSLAGTDPMVTPAYDWKFLAATVVSYFTDEARNKGKERRRDLVKDFVKCARESVVDKLEDMSFADGTGNSKLDWDGLLNLVSATPTTALTVGGLDQATYPWWQNGQTSGTTPFSTNGMNDMRSVANKVIIEGGHTDAIITDRVAYELLEAETTEYLELRRTDTPDLRWGAIPFGGARVYFAPKCTSGYFYFLDFDSLELILDPGNEFRMTEWTPLAAAGQLDKVAYIVSSGDWVCWNRRRQHVLTGYTS